MPALPPTPVAPGADLVTPDTTGTARPAPGTLSGRAPDGCLPGRGALTLRGDGLDLVFRREVDGDGRRWPGRAREVAARHLELWKLGGLVDDARLVVSELLSNAVCHGHGDVTLRLTCRDDGFRLDVTTTGAAARNQPCAWGPENLPSPGEDKENGRGLLLVQVLADDWGVSEDGSLVWCILTAVNPAAAEPECAAAASWPRVPPP